MIDHDFPSDSLEPKWYVLFVRSNQEKRVAQNLKLRGVEHWLPCYSSLRQWKDRRVTLEMPLFPGYVFVRLPLLERTRVLAVPNVVSLVGPRDSPSVISEDEITWIKRGIEHGKASPHEYLQEGEWVEIIDGALRGMQGIFLRRQNGTRVVISLDSITRAFLVEVQTAWLKPLAPRRNLLTGLSANHETKPIPNPLPTPLQIAQLHSADYASGKSRCA